MKTENNMGRKMKGAQHQMVFLLVMSELRNKAR